MGSSMGGVISLQAALLNPDVFGKIGCLSPAMAFKDNAGRDYFDLLAAVGKVPVRIYIDSGTAGPGQDGAPDTRRMGQALLDAGWKDGIDLMRFEDAGAEHNERAWRARLDKPLVFLFGKAKG
jgi:predicted alpha/beta superfamily hydrolase